MVEMDEDREEAKDHKRSMSNTKNGFKSTRRMTDRRTEKKKASIFAKGGLMCDYKDFM